MGKLIKCNNISTRGYIEVYTVKEVDDFYNNINIEKSVLKLNEKIYFMSKTISQSKVREVGFTIVREKLKADIIIIDDVIALGANRNKWNSTANNFTFDEKLFNNFMDILINEEHLNYKYMLSKDFYKYLYKYDGNLELYNNCNELFNSGSVDNCKIAMEFISNANWTNNEIYLIQLFGDHFSYNMNNHYKNSISFKGFLTSLNFNYNNCKMYSANEYSSLCKNQEHHDWVYNKFKDEFEEELKDLFVKHKIKLNNIDYEINK